VRGGRPRYEVPRWRAIRQIETAAPLTAPIGQRSVVLELRGFARAGREMLDMLTGEGSAVHGSASVSQHESRASKCSSSVLPGMWRGRESTHLPEKLQ
jgi:hypothetical protein